MDVTRLKDSWKKVAAYGDEVPLFFYSTLFLTHPETRRLFPVSMSAQRDRLVAALGRIVSDVDRVDELLPFLQQLGRDHRKFAVVAEHYPAVGQALLHTLSHFLGPEWTPDLAEDWEEAYGLVAKVMTEAADEAAATTPPWWDARVVWHERRTADIAALRVQPEYQLDYTPGQSVAVESRLRPNVWRYFTPANAPRRNGTVDLHVRLVGGGPVSTALVQGVAAGDTLRLGAPVGDRSPPPAGATCSWSPAAPAWPRSRPCSNRCARRRPKAGPGAGRTCSSAPPTPATTTTTPRCTRWPGSAPG